MTCANVYEIQISAFASKASMAETRWLVPCATEGSFHSTTTEAGRHTRIRTAHEADIYSLALSRKPLLTPGVKDITERPFLRPNA